LEAQVTARPEAPALIAQGSTSTYSELGAAVRRCGDFLVGLGVRAGDRVAIIGTNSAGWVISFLGCLDVGAIAVPMNYRLGRAEIDAQLRLAEPRAVLADEGLAATVEPAVLALGAAFRSLTHDARQGPSSEDVPAREARDLPDPDAPALISFTSGSTGAPKGALITHRALAAAAEAYATGMRTGPDDRTLIMVPLFHNTGFCDQLAHMIVVGGAVDVLPRFGTAITRATLRERPATFLIAVPGILRLLMIGEGADAIFGPCRVLCYGGSPMPEAWIREMVDRWPHVRLYNAYGLTEFTSVSHLLGPEDLPERTGTVGRPVAGVEQLIVDEQGAPLRSGTTGRILISGPTCMAGYWRAPELTDRVLQGRWLDTGDLGSVTPDGFLVLAGRTSDVINRGGEKISPLQVEAALSVQPGVAEATVVGAPHAIFGQCVVAFVTVTAGAALDIDALRAGLRHHVADYAIPEHFVLEDDLPRNAAGKVDRLELRRVAAETLGGAVSA
jgi:long-chain acyl-CoA synthetase